MSKVYADQSTVASKEVADSAEDVPEKGDATRANATDDGSKKRKLAR